MATVAVAAPLRSTTAGEPTVLRPDRFVPVAVDTQLASHDGMPFLPTVGSLPFDATLIGNPVDRNPPQRIAYGSLTAAAQEFRPRARIPAALPSQFQNEPEVAMYTASSASYVLDLPKMQRLLAGSGLPDLQLPTTMHGAKLTVDVPAALTMHWGTGRDSLILTQMRQPKVTVPAEAELPAVRELLLSHPRVETFDPDVVAQVRGIDLWQTTLPIPIPNGATGEPVRVDGADGLLVSHGDHGGAALIWQRNGVVFGLAGPLEPQELLTIADSLR
jgi:hypothetical protein